MAVVGKSNQDYVCAMKLLTVAVLIPMFQHDVFERFATGVFNLIVATKSLEDLDVPKASVVIQFASSLYFMNRSLTSSSDTISSKVKSLTHIFAVEPGAVKVISSTLWRGGTMYIGGFCLV